MFQKIPLEIVYTEILIVFWSLQHQHLFSNQIEFFNIQSEFFNIDKIDEFLLYRKRASKSLQPLTGVLTLRQKLENKS